MMAFRPARQSAGEPTGHGEGRRSKVAAWLSALSFAGLGRSVGARPHWEREADGAIRPWLRLVDGGRHRASWASASPLLRRGVGPGEWESALRAVRTPLGRCFWRKLQSCAAVEGPPGDLRGPYVVIRFESVFEHGSRAIETVTAMRGPDDRWRPAAYFIG